MVQSLIDCRISAYPKYTDFYVNMTGIAPSLLHVDIDRLQFETIVDLASANTRANFKKILPNPLSYGQVGVTTIYNHNPQLSLKELRISRSSTSLQEGLCRLRNDC